MTGEEMGQKLCRSEPVIRTQDEEFEILGLFILLFLLAH